MKQIYPATFYRGWINVTGCIDFVYPDISPFHVLQYDLQNGTEVVLFYSQSNCIIGNLTTGIVVESYCRTFNEIMLNFFANKVSFVTSRVLCPQSHHKRSVMSFLAIGLVVGVIGAAIIVTVVGCLLWNKSWIVRPQARNRVKRPEAPSVL